MIFQNTLVKGIAFFIPNEKLRQAFTARYSRKTKYRKLKDRYIELKERSTALQNQLNAVRRQSLSEPQGFKTLQYLAAMLKAYGIENVIASSGTTHAMFCLALQNDSFFKMFSVVDERSAAYAATGMAYSTGRPVVITCTQSSASRNYVPALTEGFYRNVPVIAVAFYARNRNEHNLSAQYIDRAATQNDSKIYQVRLPEILDATDKRNAITYINTAIFNAVYFKKPVLIECPAIYDFKNTFLYIDLPTDFWTTQIIESVTQDEKNELSERKNIAVFVGSHARFTEAEEKALSDFAQSYNAPVFCNHTSSYYGKNRVQCQLAALAKIPKAEVVIDIGGPTNEGMYGRLFAGAKIYRIIPDGDFKCRDGRPVAKAFVISEERFFREMYGKLTREGNYYEEIVSAIASIKFPDLPLSAFLIAKELSQNLPDKSMFHYGVSNTKRAVNYFEFKNRVESFCNVGTCGIEGAVSTALGAALSNPKQMVFAMMGDLTFFYDMNAIQNRDLKNNLRILLVNNHQGVEMKLSLRLNDNDLVIAAKGHHTDAEGWVKSCGLHYMSASSSNEFLKQVNDFCTKDFGKSVLFEVFTTEEDEINAYNSMMQIGK